MLTPKACERCGATFETSPGLDGLCAACMLKASLEPEVVVTRGQDRRPAPSIEALAPHFPDLEILELVGQGGMGAVYRVRQKSLGRDAALKVLALDAGTDPAFGERFEREACLLASLAHPNIVSVYGAGRAGPHWYLLMELVEGASLRQLIVARELDPRSALSIVGQVCDALQAAHDRGVVHRDIKPENVIVTRKGAAKILDFGLAKLVGQGPRTANTLTETGQVMGTVRYMAPEQWDRPLAVDHRADIYSLGVVMYELLTGELPMGRFPLPSKKAAVGTSVDQIVLKTLEKEPEQRYQHASDVRADVQRVEFSPGVPTARHDAPASGSERMSGARIVVIVSASLCAMAACAVAALALVGAANGGGLRGTLVMLAIGAVFGVPAALVWATRRRQTASPGSALGWGLLGCAALTVIVVAGLGAAAMWGSVAPKVSRSEAMEQNRRAEARAELAAQRQILGDRPWTTAVETDASGTSEATWLVDLEELRRLAPFARTVATGDFETDARARWATVVWPMHIAMLTPSKVQDRVESDKDDLVSYTIPAMPEELERQRDVAEILFLGRAVLGDGGAPESDDFLAALPEVRVIADDRTLHVRARLEPLRSSLRAYASRPALAAEVDACMKGNGLAERMEFGREEWRVELRGRRSANPTARITLPDGTVRDLDSDALRGRYAVLLHLAK